MSSIYLVLVVGILILLFRQDQKEWPPFSLALWVPLIWLVSTTTKLVGIFSGRGGISGMPSIEAATTGDPIARAVYIVLILLGLIVYSQRKERLSEFLRANRGILLLYAYVFLTIVWADSPWVSFKRYINICGSLLMAFIVASEADHHKALEHIFRRYAAIGLVLSLYYVKTNRNIGYVIGVHGEHFMAGITGHKNELGILCMFSLIFLFWRAVRRLPSVNYLDIALILIGSYLVIRAQCTTAIVLSILGMALISGLEMLKISFRRLMIFIIILVIATSPVLIIIMNSPGSVISGAFFSATGKDATLSGRIPMWRDLIQLGKNDILLGTGYESFWISHYREIWAFWSFRPTNAHNGFVEVLLNMGLIGLAISVVLITKSLLLVGSERGLTQPSAHWYLVILIMFVIGNITEASLLNMTLGWTLYLMISANNEKDRLMRSLTMMDSESSSG